MATITAEVLGVALSGDRTQSRPGHGGFWYAKVERDNGPACGREARTLGTKMKTDQIIRTITGMRDRDNVQAIRHAAEQRDLALMERESYRISKRVFERFAHLKRGDQVFIHLAESMLKPMQRWMHGKPLIVWAVHPKNRMIEVRTGEIERVQVKTDRRVRVADHWGKPKLDPDTGKAIWRQVTRTVERPRTYLMRWSVLEKLKVSTKPTKEALAYVLRGGES